MSQTHQGSCLCGSITFEVNGQLRDVIACHCGQCRKQTGLYYAATNARDSDLKVSGTDNLTWYQSSEKARRGFCRTCGSALFWKHQDIPFTSILAGSFDTPTGQQITRHIFCASKGDYYEIADGLPQSPTVPETW